jgi:hypothetical protein
MEVGHLDEAIEHLEKANADLDPELLSVSEARARLRVYARAQKLVAFGVAALARKVDDVAEVAQTTGTSVGRARDTVETGKVMGGCGELGVALQCGDVSLQQATEIAKAEESAPGSAEALVAVAKKEAFHVLKEEGPQGQARVRAAPRLGAAPAMRSQRAQLLGSARHDQHPFVPAKCARSRVSVRCHQRPQRTSRGTRF